MKNLKEKNTIKNIKIKAKPFEQYLKEKYPTKEKRTQLNERFQRLNLGYEIYLARKKKRFTQTELAKRIKTTQSVIARIEKGDQNLTTDTLNQIAKALNKRLMIEFR